MRWLYFSLSSSVLIGLVLLVRSVFRRKLSPGVIYALWLIPMLRLLVPFAAWEMPPVYGVTQTVLEVFAPAQEEEDAMEYAEYADGSSAVYDQAEPVDLARQQYGWQTETAGEENTAGTNLVEETASFVESYYFWLYGIWFVGCILIGAYTIYSNRKLKKSILYMEKETEDSPLPVCVSDAVISPCLFGFVHPCILVNRSVRDNKVLYGHVLEHELAHFAQRDHIWTLLRIILCVIYWWHPLVWVGATCAAEDAELSCDARVLRGKSTEERKSYGYSLICLLEGAQGRRDHLCAATSMSGGKKSMKRRIEGITQGNSTRHYVLIPLGLLFMMVFVLGCGIPTSKSWMKNVYWYGEGTMDMTTLEAEYEFALKDEITSRLFYYEIYHHGNLTDRHILAYGDLDENKNRPLTMILEMSDDVEQIERYLTLEQDGVSTRIPMQIPGRTVQRFAGSCLVSEEKVEIHPGDDYVVFALYLPFGDEPISTYSCEALSAWTGEELDENLKEQYLTVLIRMAFSDLPGQQLRDTYEEKTYPYVNIKEEAGSEAFVKRWAKGFCDRDGDVIVQMAALGAENAMEESGLLLKEEGYVSFGWSSPWPWSSEDGYQIMACTDSQAEILYYAKTSAPEKEVWREIIQYEVQNGIYQVTDEHLERQ